MLSLELLKDLQEYIEENYVPLVEPQFAGYGVFDDAVLADISGLEFDDIDDIDDIDEEIVDADIEGPIDIHPAFESIAHERPVGRPSYHFRARRVAAESSSNVLYDFAGPFEPQDESFSEMLIRKISEKGISWADCYNKANVSRQVFSNICNKKGYNPNKQTVCAFMLALELPIEEAVDMYRKAGYAFSPSSKFDLIVKYFIEHGVYDIMDVNDVLFENDQPLLGTK